MAPGWHVTTASSGILYRERDRAAGDYTLTAKLHLFPEAAGHREAYGIFVGGSDLQGAGQHYLYFLLRGDGAWKVKRRDGASATDVSGDWKVSPAVVKGKADGPVSNTVTVAVTGGKLTFGVNGQQLYTAPAAGLKTDGIFGLRINHNLSVHVESLGLGN